MWILFICVCALLMFLTDINPIWIVPTVYTVLLLFSHLCCNRWGWYKNEYKRCNYAKKDWYLL